MITNQVKGATQVNRYYTTKLACNYEYILNKQNKNCNKIITPTEPNSHRLWLTYQIRADCHT